MIAAVRFGLALALVSVVACASGSSPTRPDDGDAPPDNPPVTGHIVTGTAVNVLTDGAAASIGFATDGVALGRSAADGTFRVGFSASGVNRLTMSGTGFVERQTGVEAPSISLRLSLIPSSFDLNSFNQMFRHTQGADGAILTRWTSAPALLIERRVLRFTGVGAPAYTALEATLTDAEVASIRTDMTDGYALLTAGRLGTFTSVRTRTTAEDDPVSIAEAGTVVVTRQAGLTSATGFWGYARWSTTADGVVTRGFIILDRDFETSTSPLLTQYRRSLRMHELGHTLGCQHVSGIVSVMNANARTEPNTFDQQAARIAMLRPAGNRAPDVDPTGHTATTARAAAARTWHGAH